MKLKFHQRDEIKLYKEFLFMFNKIEYLEVDFGVSVQRLDTYIDIVRRIKWDKCLVLFKELIEKEREIMFNREGSMLRVCSWESIKNLTILAHKVTNLKRGSLFKR